MANIANQNLESILHQLGAIILCCRNDDALTIVYAGPCFYDSLGYEQGEISCLLPGTSQRVISEDVDFDRDSLKSEIKRDGFAEHEIKLICKNGHHIWINCRICLLQDDNEEEFFCGIMIKETSARRSQRKHFEHLEAIQQAESNLAESEQRYRIIMEEAADPIFDYDLIQRQCYCSPSFQKKLDFNITGGNYMNKIRYTDFVFEDDRERAWHDTINAMKNPGQQAGEYRLKNTNGRYLWYRVRSSVISNQYGCPTRIIVFLTDIDKQKKETMLLKERAERDLLTGLYNHVTTTSMIDKAIEKSENGASHALFLVDIDNFKSINDSLGHIYGDEVVGEVGMKLMQQFRDEDIIGRIGGDEFVVFLQNISSEKIVSLKARVLNQLFRTTQSNGKVTCKISCSVGVAIYPQDGRNYHELIQKADIAMYAVKKSGKDNCCIYSNELDVPR